MGINNTMKLDNYKREVVIYKGLNYTLSDKMYIGTWIDAYLIGDEKAFRDVLNSDFPIIKGVLTDTNPKTFDDFLALVNETKRKIILNNLQHLFNPEDIYVHLYHLLQPGEAEDFYESSMTLVINGHEWDTFYDGTHPVPPLPFEVSGYIHKGWYNFHERIDYVPAEQSIVFPLLYDENRRCSFTFISKACIDKAILYKRFKDPATIGTFESYRAYTGKVETLELDFHNIDEAVLQEFIKHGVIDPLNKPLEEKEVAEQVAFAREQAVLSQEAYKDWLNKNEAL